MAKLTKSEVWFKDNVSENEKELIEIGEIANRILHEKLCIGLNNPMQTIAIYAKVFEALCEVIKDKQDKWDSFVLNVANRLKIGYTTTNNEDDEKQGNFMVFIQNVDNVQADDSLDEDETNAIELCSQWNAANVKEQADVIKDAAAKGRKNLDELINIKIESHEFVIPVFCVIHSAIISYIRLKKVELNQSEYTINVAGLYDITILNNEDGEEEIFFDPSVSLKLMLKNDETASRED